MGLPNVMRDGSNYGNVSAQALAEAGLLDVLASLVHAVFAPGGGERTTDPPTAVG